MDSGPGLCAIVARSVHHRPAVRVIRSSRNDWLSTPAANISIGPGLVRATAIGLTVYGVVGVLSSQLHSLSGNLRSMGAALETSGTNLAEVQVEVQGLATRLEALTGDSGIGLVPAGMLRLALGGLLLGLAIPALGALALGVTLLRLGRSVRAA